MLHPDGVRSLNQQGLNQLLKDGLLVMGLEYVLVTFSVGEIGFLPLDSQSPLYL